MPTIKQVMEHLMAEKAREEGRAMPGPSDCPWCGANPPFAFRDELSAKEHGISGMCQACQDEHFAPYPEDAP